jgi:glycosyltransferase involved in cell wall biosynthesis
MRLLFVVQRYGHEVAGGAERHCWEFATRLARRGHDVEVLTSRAQSYVDWSDVYPAGSAEVDGVRVHRLSVTQPRSERFFGPLNARVVWGNRPVPLHLQEHWIRSSGPLLPDLGPWLAERGSSFDVAIFFSYLYYPTWAGLPVAAGLTTTVLHPTAHEEPPLYLPLFQTTLRQPSALAFSTQEEEVLVRRCFKVSSLSAVIGIGIDIEEADGDDDGAAFREAHHLDGRPYLLFLGRIDPAKGTEELFDFFVAYKIRNPGSLILAMVGDRVRPLPFHPDVVVTGVVDEAMKRSALAGAVALVQPSFFESFSMVLIEAWAQRKAVLVQGHCAVLEGQVRRSGGGIPYRGFGEFEVATRRLVEDPALATHLAEAGHRYTEDHYTWNKILARYERLLLAASSSTPGQSGRGECFTG